MIPIVTRFAIKSCNRSLRLPDNRKLEKHRINCYQKRYATLNQAKFQMDSKMIKYRSYSSSVSKKVGISPDMAGRVMPIGGMYKFADKPRGDLSAFNHTVTTLSTWTGGQQLQALKFWEKGDFKEVIYECDEQLATAEISWPEELKSIGTSKPKLLSSDSTQQDMESEKRRQLYLVHRNIKAAALNHLQKYESAIHIADETLKMTNRQNRDALCLKATALNGLGNLTNDKSLNEQSLNHFNEALQLNKSNPIIDMEAELNTAILTLKIGQVEKALHKALDLYNYKIFQTPPASSNNSTQSNKEDLYSDDFDDDDYEDDHISPMSNDHYRASLFEKEEEDDMMMKEDFLSDGENLIEESALNGTSQGRHTHNLQNFSSSIANSSYQLSHDPRSRAPRPTVEDDPPLSPQTVSSNPLTSSFNQSSSASKYRSSNAGENHTQKIQLVTLKKVGQTQLDSNHRKLDPDILALIAVCYAKLKLSDNVIEYSLLGLEALERQGDLATKSASALRFYKMLYAAYMDLQMFKEAGDIAATRMKFDRSPDFEFVVSAYHLFKRNNRSFEEVNEFVQSFGEKQAHNESDYYRAVVLECVLNIEYGKFDKALILADELLKLNRCSLSYSLKGQCLYSKGKPSQAIRVCNEAILAGFGTSDIMLTKAASLDKEGKHDEALQMYDSIIVNEDQHLQLAWFHKASLLLALDRNDEASQIVTKLQNKFPDFAEAWFLEAQVHYAQGHIALATTALTTAKGMNPMLERHAADMIDQMTKNALLQSSQRLDASSSSTDASPPRIVHPFGQIDPKDVPSIVQKIKRKTSNLCKQSG